MPRSPVQRSAGFGSDVTRSVPLCFREQGETLQRRSPLRNFRKEGDILQVREPYGQRAIRCEYRVHKSIRGGAKNEGAGPPREVADKGWTGWISSSSFFDVSSRRSRSPLRILCHVCPRDATRRGKLRGARSCSRPSDI